MKKKLLRKRKQTKQAPTGRITNETVAEHRERILAGGRKFKYPRQYARHKLVINTIIISAIVLILLVAVGWWQLYVVQNTSDFFYRVTKVLPIPVASVDGNFVRYSDYLANLNSSKYYLQQKEQVNLDSEDGQRQEDFYKSASMNLVVRDTYAAKIARERSISVSDDEVTKYIDQQRQTRSGKVSEETYQSVLEDYYGWSLADYRRAMKANLLTQKVAYAVDDQAKQQSEAATRYIKQYKGDLSKVAKALSDKTTKIEVVSPGSVPVTNQDGGITQAALELRKNQVSEAVQPVVGDGFYFIKLLDKSPEQVTYSYIRIPLAKFSQQLEEVKKSGKVQKYIKVDDVSTTIEPIQGS